MEAGPIRIVEHLNLNPGLPPLNIFFTKFLQIKGEIFLHGLMQDPWAKFRAQLLACNLKMAEIKVPKVKRAMWKLDRFDSIQID